MLGGVLATDVDLAMVCSLKFVFAEWTGVRLLTTVGSLVGGTGLLQLEELRTVATFVLNVGITTSGFLIFSNCLFLIILGFNIIFFLALFDFRILTFGARFRRFRF